MTVEDLMNLLAYPSGMDVRVASQSSDDPDHVLTAEIVGAELWEGDDGEGFVAIRTSPDMLFPPRPDLLDRIADQWALGPAQLVTGAWHVYAREKADYDRHLAEV